MSKLFGKLFAKKLLTKHDRYDVLFRLVKSNEVWLSLVARYVREQITDYERKNSKTAENP